MYALAMAGQDPLKMVVGQALHRLGLLGPGVPTIILGSRQPLLATVPVQMIASKQEAVVDQQHAMAARMTGRLNGHETGSQLPGAGTVEHEFSRRLRRELVAMDNLTAAEVLGKALGIGDIVTMRQENVINTAQLF